MLPEDQINELVLQAESLVQKAKEIAMRNGEDFYVSIEEQWSESGYDWDSSDC